jgi:hypothetical protein
LAEQEINLIHMMIEAVGNKRGERPGRDVDQGSNPSTPAGKPRGQSMLEFQSR